jgi:gas vesicle structural protein
MTTLAPTRSQNLADVVERILDKGLVINADIAVSVAGTELLGIKIRATLASFETAAKYGLELPSGTNLNAPGWKELDKPKAYCPECQNRMDEKRLLEDGCSICGWCSPMQRLSLIRPESEKYE